MFLTLLVSGCQTHHKPMTEAPLAPGEIFGRDGRVDIEDLKKNKSHRISVSSYILPNQKMRVEATGPLSIPIATLLVTEDRIQAQLYREKKYLFGIFPRVWERENPTLRAISIPISPKVLQAIVLDKNLDARSWKCSSSADGSKVCQNLRPSEHLPDAIFWSPEIEGSRTVKADSANFKMTWTLGALEKVVAKENMFVLRVNENYQKVDITPR